MNLKVGDKVKIMPKKRFDKLRKGGEYVVRKNCMFLMSKDMAAFCSKKATVVSVVNSHVKLDIDIMAHNWCEWMFDIIKK